MSYDQTNRYTWGRSELQRPFEIAVYKNNGLTMENANERNAITKQALWALNEVLSVYTNDIVFVS